MPLNKTWCLQKRYNYLWQVQLPIKSNIKSIYGFFLFAMIDEVSSSYKLHVSCSIHMENFVSFELEVSLQRLCESNMGWASPISLIIFLVRSSSESSTLTALLFENLWFGCIEHKKTVNVPRFSHRLRHIISIDFVATLLSQIETLEVLILTLFKPFPLYSWWFEPPAFRRGINDILRYKRYRVCHEAGFLDQHCLGQVWWHMTALLCQEVFHVPVHTCAFRRQGGAEGMKIAEKIWHSCNLGTETA